MRSSNSFTLPVMIGFLLACGTVFAQGQGSVSELPPGAGPGMPPSPKLLGVRASGDLSPVVPIVAPRLPNSVSSAALTTPAAAPELSVTKDGATLEVATRYAGSFTKFHVDAHVKAADGVKIDSVSYTGPGRFQRTVTDAAGGFAIELETDQPFVLKAKVRAGKDAKPTELSLDVAPAVQSMPLRPGIAPAAIATKMRTGGWQFELKLNGELATAPAVVEAEWTLPEGFKQPVQRTHDASTGFGVTGAFDKSFPAAVRVLFADGTVGLAVVQVDPQE